MYVNNNVELDASRSSEMAEVGKAYAQQWTVVG
jgi:hypothetical protein